MPSAIEVTPQIVSAATALAGLLLVFLGAVGTGFKSFEKTEQSSVRSRYQTRAWLAFVGFVLALLAAVLALVGRWLGNECAALASLILLAVALVWVLFTGLSAVREIK